MFEVFFRQKSNKKFLIKSVAISPNYSQNKGDCYCCWKLITGKKCLTFFRIKYDLFLISNDCIKVVQIVVIIFGSLRLWPKAFLFDSKKIKLCHQFRIKCTKDFLLHHFDQSFRFGFFWLDFRTRATSKESRQHLSLVGERHVHHVLVPAMVTLV